jgi:hypothetical protein
MIIRKKASKEEIEKMAEHFNGYVKVVVDVERKVLAGGSGRHYLNEQELLEDASSQKNLWGGGIELKSREIDYNSIINLRPNQDNPSRDILSIEIRKQFDDIVNDLIR